MEGEPDNVTRMADYRRVERINGVRMPLGTMGLNELDMVIETCRLREQEARLERQIAEDYRDRRFPDGDGAQPA